MNTAAPSLKSAGPAFHGTNHSSIVVISDEQIRAVAADPDRPVKGLDFGNREAEVSFCSFADRAKERGSAWITFFHDYFFGGNTRELGPTHPEFIKAVQVMHGECQKRGLGLGASIINPLDLGRDFKARFGAGGVHRVFFEGALDRGEFELTGYLPKRWVNNKGPISLSLEKIRLFSFAASPHDRAYTAVPFGSISEITEDFSHTVFEGERNGESGNFEGSYIKIKGNTANPGNRVLAVLHMATPEMDYFHPEAEAYVRSILDMYDALGVRFAEFYSDEMHIQFDWDFAHFGPNEIMTRYMTDSFEKQLALADPMFEDFDKMLVYHSNMQGETPSAQNVLGAAPELLYKTFYQRKIYFETLQKTVVSLIDGARKYSEELYGFPVRTLGHATWQESPTCDKYHPAGVFQAASAAGASMYDYTPDFVYSSSIREAISACYDYFQWNDYFSGGGNDFCECGWFDRNYYGGAMTASMAALNRYESCYWGAWGMPNSVRNFFNMVAAAYGAGAGRNAWVNGGRGRKTDVVIVYPKDLIYCDERFGSWTVQYGYANYITAEKLENAPVKDGRIYVGNTSHSAVVVAFEPFATDALLQTLERLVVSGGKALWMSAFPVGENGCANPKWESLFGVRAALPLPGGTSAEKVVFEGAFAHLPPMKVLTDFIVDRVYPIELAGASPAASAAGKTVAACRELGKGRAAYFGCRLRDDQTASTGEDVSALFDVLCALGAYGAGAPEVLARKGEYFFSGFENGALAASPHYRGIYEAWPGGFSRDEAEDARAMEGRALPSEAVRLDGVKIAGQTVSYRGEGVVFWNAGEEGLSAFSGSGTVGITVDGREYALCKEESDVSFAPLCAERVPEGFSAGLWLYSAAEEVFLPFALPEGASAFVNVSGDGRRLVPAKIGFSRSRSGVEINLKGFTGSQLVILW